MNVILIVVDNLRADHLGINDYSRNTSPNIDKIAKEGVFFPVAIPTFPGTTPSITSILTGLYPHSHGIRNNDHNNITPGVTSLQEILQSHGYITIGNAIEMRATDIKKGFHAFNLLRWRIMNKIKRSIKKTINWKYRADTAEILTDFAIKYIKKLENKKFFLYLHYIGPHWPYDSPKPYNHIFDPHYKGKHTFNKVAESNRKKIDSFFNKIVDSNKIKRGDLIFNNKLPKEEIDHAIAHYDGSIRYVDFHIGRLLEYLDNSNLTNNTLIIVCGDHGECFGEHNIYFHHGEGLYDEELRVPLIMKCPNLPNIRIENQVQLTDVMPTILEILGIPFIEKIEGVSLISQIKENKVGRKYTFSETGRSFFKQNKRVYFKGIRGKWRMVRSNDWKLIYIPHPGNDIYELYNLKTDPHEKINLIEKEKKVAEIMKKELFEWMKDVGSEEEPDLTEKSKRLLQKLGYIE